MNTQDTHVEADASQNDTVGVAQTEDTTLTIQTGVKAGFVSPWDITKDAAVNTWNWASSWF